MKQREKKKKKKKKKKKGRKKERKRKTGYYNIVVKQSSSLLPLYTWFCMLVCVCVWERDEWMYHGVKSLVSDDW